MADTLFVGHDREHGQMREQTHDGMDWHRKRISSWRWRGRRANGGRWQRSTWTNLDRVGVIASGGAALLGALSLLGWLTKNLLLASFSPTYIPMAPSTALAVVLLASGILVLLTCPRSRPVCHLPILFALLVVGASLWISAEFLLGLPPRLEALLVPDPGPFGLVTVGRMAPLTAALFLLSASALLVTCLAEGRPVANLAGTSAAGVVVVAVVVVLGYAYGQPLLYGGTIIPVALPTALAFGLLGVGLVSLVGPHAAPLRFLIGSDARARLFRAFLPLTGAILVTQALLDRVLLVGVNPALQDALSALGTTAVVGVLVARTVLVLGGELAYAERTRARALGELQESNQRLEAALADVQRTQQQIVQQERLHAMGQMAAGLAHDFNNALALIIGFCELLLVQPKALDNRALVTQRIQAIHSAGTNAAEMVGRLRDFYRARDPHEPLGTVDLRALVQQIVVLTQPRWQDQARGRGIQIDIQTDLRPVPPIEGDGAELRDVVTNLVFNAVDALPHGGTITLHTGAAGDQVVLAVGDTGVGMSDEVRRRCLEPFFTTKGERGTGLGLAVMAGVVQRHRGTVEIASQLGAGTTISLTFPAHALKASEPDVRAPVAVPRGRRILVVEDDPWIRQIVREYLSEDGHVVTCAADGRLGFDAFQRGADPDGGSGFDLVISDVAMPELSGNQLAVAIKALSPTTKVILLTGFGDILQMTNATPDGVDLVVSKPVTLAALLHALDVVLP